MRFSKTVIVLSGILCLTYAGRLPPKCCFPKQYETFVHGIGGLQDYENYSIDNGTLRTAFDGINQLTFTHEHSYSVTNVFPIPIPLDNIDILDYKANQQWRVYNDGTCDKEEVGLPLYEECIPGNATLVSEGKFGPGGKMMQTYLFHDRIYLDPYEITISVIMSDETEGECYPVRMSFSSAYVFDSNKNVDITTADIYDFTPGIKDRSVFIPPSVCPDTIKKSNAHNNHIQSPGGIIGSIYRMSARMKQHGRN